MGCAVRRLSLSALAALVVVLALVLAGGCDGSEGSDTGDGPADRPSDRLGAFAQDVEVAVVVL